MDDCGGAFSMGSIGGGIFQAVKGFRNAPRVSSPNNASKEHCPRFPDDFLQCFFVLGCGAQTAGKCKCCKNQSAADWR